VGIIQELINDDKKLREILRELPPKKKRDFILTIVFKGILIGGLCSVLPILGIFIVLYRYIIHDQNIPLIPFLSTIVGVGIIISFFLALKLLSPKKLIKRAQEL